MDGGRGREGGRTYNEGENKSRRRKYVRGRNRIDRWREVEVLTKEKEGKERGQKKSSYENYN